MTIPWCLRRAELVFKCVKGKSFPVIERRASQREGKVASVSGALVKYLTSQIFHNRVYNIIFYQLRNKHISIHPETRIFG
jgi:hypothetical protein